MREPLAGRARPCREPFQAGEKQHHLLEVHLELASHSTPAEQTRPAERHADHPRGPDADAMALEARIDRQRQDFDAVSEGKMTASAFLERHVWSPFRRAVEDLSVTAE